MGDAIASQFIRHYLPRLTSIALDQAFEKALCRLNISAYLQKNINNITVLVYCSPQVLLLAVDLNEHLINVERITETLAPKALTAFAGQAQHSLHLACPAIPTTLRGAREAGS